MGNSSKQSGKNNEKILTIIISIDKKIKTEGNALPMSSHKAGRCPSSAGTACITSKEILLTIVRYNWPGSILTTVGVPLESVVTSLRGSCCKTEVAGEGTTIEVRSQEILAKSSGKTARRLEKARQRLEKSAKTGGKAARTWPSPLGL